MMKRANPELRYHWVAVQDIDKFYKVHLDLIKKNIVAIHGLDGVYIDQVVSILESYTNFGSVIHAL